MKIIYFDMTKFFVLKPFYESGEWKLKNRTILDLKVSGRENEYLE